MLVRDLNYLICKVDYTFNIDINELINLLDEIKYDDKKDYLDFQKQKEISSFIIKGIPIELLNDKTIILKLIDIGVYKEYSLHTYYKERNSHFISYDRYEGVFYKNPIFEILKEINSQFYEDIDVAYSLVKKSPIAFRYISKKIVNDERFINKILNTKIEDTNYDFFIPRIYYQNNDDLKELSIIEYVKDKIPYSERKNYYCFLCPFHDDHTPSVKIKKSDPYHYKCFVCNKSGDYFDFVSSYEGIPRHEVKPLSSKVCKNPLHYYLLANISSSFRNNQKFMKNVVELDGNLIKFGTKTIKSSLQIIKSALDNDLSSIIYVKDNVTDNELNQLIMEYPNLKEIMEIPYSKIKSNYYSIKDFYKDKLNTVNNTEYDNSSEENEEDPFAEWCNYEITNEDLPF